MASARQPARELRNGHGSPEDERPGDRRRPQPTVRLERVSKHFGDLVAVRELDLDIGPGEFFTLLGPSGCGKTTTLRMVAGFEQPTAGRVLIEGSDVAGLPSYKRPTNTVFQSYALFPHLSVRDNVAFGLRRKKVAEGRDQAAGGGGARAGRPRGRDQPPAQPALRRPAAARRSRPGARQPAQGAAARRAARRPRPEAPQGAAARAEGHPARRRHHVRLRDARPGGGADDVRPDRGHVERGRRAGGHARERVRAPQHHVRRRVHRGLQPDAGNRHRRERRPRHDQARHRARGGGRRRRDRRAASAATPWCGRRSCGSPAASTAIFARWAARRRRRGPELRLPRHLRPRSS